MSNTTNFQPINCGICKKKITGDERGLAIFQAGSDLMIRNTCPECTKSIKELIDQLKHSAFLKTLPKGGKEFPEEAREFCKPREAAIPDFTEQFEKEDLRGYFMHGPGIGIHEDCRHDATPYKLFNLDTTKPITQIKDEDL